LEILGFRRAAWY